MHGRLLFLVCLLIVFCGYGLIRSRGAADTALPIVEASASVPAAARIDFDTQVKPVLARCQPCHFSGGVMYEQLPFDRAETVKKLGEKLFTRIKAENDRKIIREFLAQDEKPKH